MSTFTKRDQLIKGDQMEVFSGPTALKTTYSQQYSLSKCGKGVYK